MAEYDVIVEKEEDGYLISEVVGLCWNHSKEGRLGTIKPGGEMCWSMNRSAEGCREASERVTPYLSPGLLTSRARPVIAPLRMRRGAGGEVLRNASRSFAPYHWPGSTDHCRTEFGDNRVVTTNVFGDQPEVPNLPVWGGALCWMQSGEGWAVTIRLG